MRYFIYKHSLNEKSYIGYTSQTIKDRLEEHVEYAKTNKSNRHFMNAISKYGSENIITEQLEEVLSKREALSREIYWIDFYNTFDAGYNMTRGGEGGDTFSNNPNKEVIREKLRKVWTGRKHSEKAKKKMSVSASLRSPISDETKQKIGDANRGKTHTNETKKKLSALGKKKVFSDEYRKKLSDTAKLRPKVVCPHCGKEGVYNSMQRWHFNKCKRRNNNV